jgi:hypothetical protein
MKTPNKWFEPSRFMLLLRRDITTHYKSLLIGIGAVAALYIFFLVFIPSFMDNPQPFIDEDFHTGGYLFAMFLGGLWFSAGIWSDVNTTQQRQFFLTLPASDLEKYISKWLITGPLFLLAFTFIYWLFSMLVNVIALGYPGVAYWQLDMMGNEVITKLVPYYLLSQPMFLAGGIWFGRFAFIKTALVALALELLLIGFVAWLGGVLFAGMGDMLEQEVNVQIDKLDQLGLGFLNTLSWLFTLLTAIFFTVLGYIRLKERGA